MSAINPLNTNEAFKLHSTSLLGKVSLNAQGLKARVHFVLQEGVQQGQSKSYLTQQIQELVQEHPQAAEELGWPTDFLAIKKQVVLPAFEQKEVESHKSNDWNTDVLGITGGKWDLPGFRATNLQSDNPYLNDFYRGVNTMVGVAALPVNYLNNIGGAILFDLPAVAEEASVSIGGPNFAEVMVAAQSSTPGIPLDDVLSWSFMRAANFSRKVALRARFVRVQPSKPYAWGNIKTLKDHYRHHGNDFKSSNMEEYAKRATQFFEQAKINKKEYRIKIDSDGIIRIWDPKSDRFGSYRPDGSTKTFFKLSPRSSQNPRGHLKNSSLEYWQGEAGVELWK